MDEVNDNTNDSNKINHKVEEHQSVVESDSNSKSMDMNLKIQVQMRRLQDRVYKDNNMYARLLMRTLKKNTIRPMMKKSS